MKLLRRGGSDESDDNRDAVDASASSDVSDPAENSPRSQTPGKGRPTPSRREAEGRKRGPVAPAPMTAKEARARRKATRGSKEDRKAASAERRADASERRAKMLAGDERYLLPRDRGPVRAYVRDLVDSRRNLVGLFMPMALILIVAMFLGPAIQQYVTLVMLVMLVLMVIEGVYIGRMVNKKARARYPDSTDGGFGLGWYAFVRASQIRKLRAPLPRVSPGDAV